jgi:hypothetical protein
MNPNLFGLTLANSGIVVVTFPLIGNAFDSLFPVKLMRNPYNNYLEANQIKSSVFFLALETKRYLKLIGIRGLGCKSKTVGASHLMLKVFRIMPSKVNIPFPFYA